MASYCLSRSKKISTVTPDVFNWCEIYRAPLTENERLFAPLVSRKYNLVPNEIADVIDWWGRKGVSFSSSRKVITFVGSISDAAYDFSPVKKWLPLFRSLILLYAVMEKAIMG